MTQKQLIDDLISRTQTLIDEVQALKALSVQELSERPTSDRWSVLDCLEHLNLYGDFYLDEIDQCIQRGREASPNKGFKSGWFGEKTCQDMLPKEGKWKTMNTFKSKNPIYSSVNQDALDRFLGQQKQMLSLLERAVLVDLTKTKTRITLPLIKFRLGTTLKFVIYHNQRHIWQAQNVLREIGVA